ncbi:motility protein A [bacterium]|nr:motility protein A [bacterium]
MKISSFLGILIGFGLVFWAISRRGDLEQFLHPEALLIVLGGTLGATILSYSFPQIVSALGALRVVFFGRTPDTEALIPDMVEVVRQARVGGPASVELSDDVRQRLPFLERGLELLGDGFDPDDVAEILRAESDAIGSRFILAERMFTTLATYSPLFGLVGTLIGLIIMLSSVSDPKAIPPAMAVALVTTFYGVLFAALIFRPIAAKIRSYTYDALLLRELVIDTVTYFNQGINSQVARERLDSTFRKRRRA